MNENIHFNFKFNNGQNCFSQVRSLERTSRKIASYRNHLRFSLRCLKERVTPPSIRLRSNVFGERAEKILELAEKKLLNKGVHQVHFTIIKLKRKQDRLSTNLSSLLPDETWDRVKLFTEAGQLSQHRIRNNAKLTNLHGCLQLINNRMGLPVHLSSLKPLNG